MKTKESVPFRGALTEEQKQWLSTAVFPDYFSINVSTSSAAEVIYEMEVLDRNSAGNIPLILERCGLKGFVLKAKDKRFNRTYAVKLAHPEDYPAYEEHQETIQSASLEDAASIFAIPIAAGRVKKFEGMPGDFTELVAFIVPWVEGKTIKYIFEHNPDEVTPEWICNIARTLYQAIIFLERRNLKHDDLHSGNVMISALSKDLALGLNEETEARVVIVDTGSLKARVATTTKDYDDHSRFIEILVSCYNIIVKNRYLVTAHPLFAEKLKTFINKLSDEDQGRHFPEPKDVDEEIKALKASINQQFILGERIFHPTDAISAEHLADDSLLLSLFIKDIPWFNTVINKAPVVLTGPRGCGKSMILRYLSVKTHLSDIQKATQRLEELPFLGVYISCSSDLQNHLLWLARDPELIHKNSRKIATFFLLVVLKELFRTLALIQDNKEISNLYGLSDKAVEEAIKTCEQFLPKENKTLRLRGKNQALHFSEELDRLRVKLSISLLQNNKNSDISIALPDALLGEVTDKLVANSSGLVERPIAFLLDDYTSHRISLPIQQVLNRIVWERKPSHVFKITCEKYGFEPKDLDGLLIESDREYIQIDAGSYVLDATSKTNLRLKFVKDLLNARLNSANWVATAETLIGLDGFQTDKSLAVEIRKVTSEQGKAYYYYGLNVLANLWTGDIASLLHIVREMFIRGSVNKSYDKKIPSSIQHDAISGVSKALNARIRAHHPHGQDMSDLMEAYGNMVRDILVNGSNFLSSKKDTIGQPRRMIQIEFATSNPQAFLNQLTVKNPRAGAVAKELLRRAIFVELPSSRAKEGTELQTVRWQMRRIFLPAYASSFLRTGYLDIKTEDDFVQMLINPAEFCSKYRASYMTGSKKQKKDNINTQDMFEMELNSAEDLEEEDV